MSKRTKNGGHLPVGLVAHGHLEHARASIVVQLLNTGKFHADARTVTGNGHRHIFISWTRSAG
jgi:hypothetical protein